MYKEIEELNKLNELLKKYEEAFNNLINYEYSNFEVEVKLLSYDEIHHNYIYFDSKRASLIRFLESEIVEVKSELKRLIKKLKETS